MSRAVNDLTQVRLLLGAGQLQITNTSLVFIVVIPLLFASDAELAIYSLLSLPFLIALGRIFAKRFYRSSLEAQERLGLLSTKVQENLGGVMTVRSYAREAAEEGSFSKLNADYLEVNLTLAKLRAFMFPMMGLFGSVGVIILLALGGPRIVSGAMTLGGFVEFNAYLAILTWPTIALGWTISLWQRGIASMDRINEIFAIEPELSDETEAPIPVAGDIEIKKLSVQYAPSGAPAVSELDLHVRPGETVVIVGRTGSGKSTILKSLARLVDVPEGTVFLDGKDVTELPISHVRSSISYAPQEAFLFSRTIFENIAFGRPEASKDEVALAAEHAGLSPDLSRLSEGLDTLVGERGITLSGGQRQRVALARALLANAPILLLDDTLAAVDTETERVILAELARHTEGKTTIIVTHRLACAQLADRIFVLDAGRIVEEGTEEELLARKGLYAEMYAKQRLRDAIETQEVVLESSAPVAVGGARE